MNKALLTSGVTGDTMSLECEIMSKQEKLEAKIRENPRNVSLEDFESLINIYGYIKERGSHPKARIGNRTMPYKKENPVKVAYVRELLQLISNISREV